MLDAPLQESAGIAHRIAGLEAQRGGPPPTAAQLAEIEVAILRVLPSDAVRRRAWSIRERYREVANPQEYAAYVQSDPPSAAPPTSESGSADATRLRTDLETLVQELHLRYSLRSAREALRTHVMGWVAIWTLVFLAVALITITIGWLQGSGGGRPRLSSRASAGIALVADGPRIAPAADVQADGAVHGLGATLLMMMIFMGALGALVSVYRRQQQTAVDGGSFVTLIEMKQGRQSVMMSPMFGAVFAIVLYLVFAGGLLQGSLFPKIYPPEGTGTESKAIRFMEFFLASGPIDAVNMAKVLVWSFLAGFAEQLVPDVLSRIVSQAQSAATRPAVK